MSEEQAQPIDATHKWLPAIEEPFFNNGLFFRRAYYKQVDGEWYSYNFCNEWVKSNNSDDWFAEGIRLNEFVEV